MRTLIAHDIRRIAVEAQCDPRTVERFLAGEDNKDVTALRVRAAMQRLGYADDIPAQRAAR